MRLSLGFLSTLGRKRRIRVYFARATNLDLPKGEVLRLYNKVRGPIFWGIKAFLPFTTKFVFRVLVFVLVLYSLYIQGDDGEGRV